MTTCPDKSKTHGIIVLVLFASFALAFALLAGCASKPDLTRHPLRVSDKTTQAEYNRIIFEDVWKKTDRYFYDATFGGHDWGAIREQYRAEAEDAKDPNMLYVTLNKMLKALGTSHAMVTSPETVAAQKKAHSKAVSLAGFITMGNLPGLDVPVVYEVVPGSPADQAGVKRGWIAIGDLLRDNPDIPVFEGEVLRQQFRDEHDELRTISMTLRYVATLDVRKIAQMRPDGILYLRFDHFDMDSAAWVREQLKTYQTQARGVLLDLRLNSGGKSHASSLILGEFFPAPVPMGRFTGRTGKSVRVIAADVSDSSAHYDGPLCVLVSRASASGAEVLAAAVQENERGEIVGVSSTGHTAGAVLLSAGLSLPDGGILQVPVRDYVTAKGVRLEGTGVRANVDAPPPTLESLRANEDPALDCAVATLLAKVAQ